MYVITPLFKSGIMTFRSATIEFLEILGIYKNNIWILQLSFLVVLTI